MSLYDLLSQGYHIDSLGRVIAESSDDSDSGSSSGSDSDSDSEAAPDAGNTTIYTSQ